MVEILFDVWFSCYCTDVHKENAGGGCIEIYIFVFVLNREKANNSRTSSISLVNTGT